MSRRVDTVFVLMIFFVFALSVFLVLMLSGSTYQNMNEIAQEGQNERIVLSYVRTKIRNVDSVSVGAFNGSSALILEEQFNGRKFITLIYLYDGWVHELFHEQGADFSPADGIPILRTDSLSFEDAENNLIRVTTDFGSLLILPRSAASIEWGATD